MNCFLCVKSSWRNFTKGLKPDCSYSKLSTIIVRYNILFDRFALGNRQVQVVKQPGIGKQKQYTVVKSSGAYAWHSIHSLQQFQFAMRNNI